MHHRYSYAGRPWPAAVLLGLALLAGRSSQAQQANLGPLFITGSLYQPVAFTNAATGNVTNDGGLVRYAGPAVAFTNNGPYLAQNGGTDLFSGPNEAAGPQELAGTTAPAFFNLVLANGTGQVFTLSNPVGMDVAGTLTLSNGKTTTTNAPAGAIRLGAAAPAVAGTLGPGAAYVDGYVAKAGAAAFTYPLGATNANIGTTPGAASSSGSAVYAPASLSNPGGTALRYLAAPPPNFTVLDQTQPAGLQLAKVSNYEYYLLSAGSTTSVTIPYDDFGPAGYVSNPATLTIAGYDGSKWTNLSSATTNATSTQDGRSFVTVSGANLAPYTAFALASTTAANPLPVELVSFTASKQEEDGLLRWATASERNSAYFEVQASGDGQSWQVVSSVPATGTSATKRTYDYLDKKLARYGTPQVYYRLRQVDLDGKTTFSPVVTLTPDGLAWGVTAYPNPYAQALTTQLTSSETGPVSITLLDALGHLVLRREVAATPGTQVITLNEAHAVAPGSYWLLVRQGSHTATVRITHE